MKTFIIAECETTCDADVQPGEKHLTWQTRDGSDPVVCLGCCRWISFTLLVNSGASL